MKVANKLKLDEQAIDDITYEQHASAYNQYYSMFTTWNQSRGKSATLRAFIDALTQVETKTIIDGYYLAVQSGKISWD